MVIIVDRKMNVLAKIVIPRTNVTMGYINNELEELAREEFFRLKKVLEIKRRMYGDKKKKAERKNTEDDEVCPMCIQEAEEAKAMQEEKVSDQEIIEQKEGVKFDLDDLVKDKQLLQDQNIIDLIKQISEIVDVTKDLDSKGLVTASVDDFIKIAEELKAKLTPSSEPEMRIEEPEQELDESICIHPKTEDDIVLNNLCESCKEKYKRKNKEAVILGDTELDEPPKSIESKETIKSKQSSTQDTYVIESDAELGTFETEVKEITKIIKTKNEDGSISIQKKVIKIEREVKAPVRLQSSQVSSQNNSTNQSRNVSYQPSSTSSGKSNPYSGSKTVGVVTVSSSDFKDQLSVHNIISKKAKSEILSPFTPMSDPVERFCMSSVTLLSTDLDFDYVVYNNTNTKTNSDWLCLKASNPMIEEIISNYEPGLCDMPLTTNTGVCTSKCSTIDINLDNNELLSEYKTQNEIDSNFSFSDSTCTKKSNKKLGLSVSFNLKSPSPSTTLVENNKK